MFNNRKSENLSTYSTEFQNDDITWFRHKNEVKVSK